MTTFTIKTRLFCLFEMTSVERLNEYKSLESEETGVGAMAVANHWPSRGEIKFAGVSFGYESSEQTTLKHVSFTINAMEKVGIIGRTGAGKSTILQAILRMAEPSGVILIDGVDITKIRLEDLRSRIAIIPVGILKILIEIFGSPTVNSSGHGEPYKIHNWKDHKRCVKDFIFYTARADIVFGISETKFGSMWRVH
jgi:hypothetical protein